VEGRLVRGYWWWGFRLWRLELVCEHRVAKPFPSHPLVTLVSPCTHDWHPPHSTRQHMWSGIWYLDLSCGSLMQPCTHVGSLSPRVVSWSWLVWFCDAVTNLWLICLPNPFCPHDPSRSLDALLQICLLLIFVRPRAAASLRCTGCCCASRSAAEGLLLLFRLTKGQPTAVRLRCCHNTSLRALTNPCRHDRGIGD